MTQFCLDSHNPHQLARFWCEVLGYVELSTRENFVEIGPAGPRGAQLTIIFHGTDAPKRDKLRLHLDVNATDRDQAAELDRLLELGAKPVDIGQRGDESWRVLADPEGNEFCLLSGIVDPV